MTKKERAQMLVERLEQVYPEGICSLDYKKAPRAYDSRQTFCTVYRRKGEYRHERTFCKI